MESDTSPRSGKDTAKRKTLDPLKEELRRLDATDVRLSLDDRFEPKAGTLLRVEIGLAFWHLPPQEFRNLVSQLPDGSGSEQIKKSIETAAVSVWHGPAPESRSTSP